MRPLYLPAAGIACALVLLAGCDGGAKAPSSDDTAAPNLDAGADTETDDVVNPTEKRSHRSGKDDGPARLAFWTKRRGLQLVNPRAARPSSYHQPRALPAHGGVEAPAVKPDYADSGLLG
jgi:hypothetical protein